MFWKRTHARNGIIENTLFEGGAFEKVDFSQTMFRNVTFKGVTLANSKFDGGQFENVKFIDCQIVDVDFDDLKPSNVELEKVKANGMSFSGSAVHLIIRNSDIRDSNIHKMGSPSSLEIIDSVYNRNSVAGEIMHHFKLINSEANESSLSVDLQTDALIDGGKISFGLGVGAKNITVRNLSDGYVAFSSDSTTDNVLIENCKNMQGFGVGIAGHIKKLLMRNVTAGRISARSANVDEFVIENSDFDVWDFNRAKIKQLKVDNVSLNKKAKFTQATVEKHNLQSLKMSGALTLELENSNLTAADFP